MLREHTTNSFKYYILLGKHQDSLASILIAYSNYDKEVSYTQGMNYIGAVVLD